MSPSPLGFKRNEESTFSMKIIYNIIGIVLIIGAIYFLTQSDWWKPLICFLVSFMFFIMGAPQPQVNPAQNKRLDELENLIGNVIFRMNEHQKQHDLNINELIKQKGKLSEQYLRGEHGK